MKRHLTDSMGREQAANFIPEGDIYRLAAKSELPGADEFESWIFDDVLPSIRRNGGYTAGQESMAPEELMAVALIMANKTIENQKARLSTLTVENQRKDPLMTPFVPLFNCGEYTAQINSLKQFYSIHHILLSILLLRSIPASFPCPYPIASSGPFAN